MNSVHSTFETRPLCGGLGCEIHGLDISDPANDSAFDALRLALDEWGVLILRDQPPNPEDMVRWSGFFGPLEYHSESNYLLEGYPEIVIVGNLEIDGVMRSLFLNSREDWHFDYAWAQQPSVGALFYAVEVPPEGGDTLFADTRTAWEALDDNRKEQLEDLNAIHDYRILDQVLRGMDPTRPALTKEKLEQWPPASHPIVQLQKSTGRKHLRFAAEVLSHVEGMSISESKKLIAELHAHVTQPRFVYRHKWQVGDLVIFDNRLVLHTATVFDANRYRRVMYRTTIMA